MAVHRSETKLWATVLLGMRRSSTGIQGTRVMRLSWELLQTRRELFLTHICAALPSLVPLLWLLRSGDFTAHELFDAAKVRQVSSRRGY